LSPTGKELKRILCILSQNVADLEDVLGRIKALVTRSLFDFWNSAVEMRLAQIAVAHPQQLSDLCACEGAECLFFLRCQKKLRHMFKGFRKPLCVCLELVMQHLVHHHSPVSRHLLSVTRDLQSIGASRNAVDVVFLVFALQI
jgi:hypothetical protein